MAFEVKKTGRFGFGMQLHVIHMTDDVSVLLDWYRETLGAEPWPGRRGEPGYLEVEDRYRILLQVSDLCIEAMAPNRPLDETKPVHRFYQRYGEHLHSIAFAVDDIAGFGNHLIAEGVRIGKPGGGLLTEVPLGQLYFYPHPRDVGMMVQITDREQQKNWGDPRERPYWGENAERFRRHPMGIVRHQYVTYAVADLERSKGIYERLWEAVPVFEGADDRRDLRFAFYQIGNTLIQLAQPTSSSTHIAQHVAQYGDMIYGNTMRVLDLDKADAYLNRKGVKTERVTPQIVAADPADCHGAPYFFSVEDIPGDPLA